MGHFSRCQSVELVVVPIIRVIFLFFILTVAGREALSQVITKGPLRVGQLNPRYFEDSAGHPVFLTGSHTWGNLQDYRYSSLTSPAPTDFRAYLKFLNDHHHNFFRLWSWETTLNLNAKQGTLRYEPMPYKRVGPAAALDGEGPVRPDAI